MEGVTKLPQPPRRRARRRSNKNFGVLPFDTSITAGNLAADAFVATNLTAIAQDAQFVSTDVYISMEAHTAGEGPVQVGIANSDLSTAEIGECLDSVPASQSDIIAIEQARRPVRNVGVLPGLNTDEVLKNGEPTRIKLQWRIRGSSDLQAWIRNKSSSPLTTGSLIKVWGKVYLRWM